MWETCFTPDVYRSIHVLLGLPVSNLALWYIHVVLGLPGLSCTLIHILLGLPVSSNRFVSC